MKYDSETQEFNTKITHHEAKELSDIVSARIQHIPKGIIFIHHGFMKALITFQKVCLLPQKVYLERVKLAKMTIFAFFKKVFLEKLPLTGITYSRY